MAINVVQLNDLPPEGQRFGGELRPAVFIERFPEGPNPSGLTTFDVTVTLDKDLILLDGVVTSEFELECCRCLRKFPYLVNLDPYESEDPREGRANLDLTEFLREDILLTLPAYPVCENLSDSAGPCPAAGRFASASEYVPISEDATAAPAKDIWSALDEISGRIDPK
jgi:uncharacterized protein